MLRPKWVVRQRHVATIVAPLALVLSMSISHQAMAACSSPDTSLNNIVTCAGDGENSDDITKSGVTSSTNGILVTPVDGEAEIENEGDITLSYTGGSLTSSVHVRGINTEAAGEYYIENAGDISVTSNGRGQLYGISGNGSVESLTVKNSGEITVDRNLASLPGQITSAAINLTDGVSGTSLSIAAGIFSEEELEYEKIVNTGTGIITAKGKMAIGIYSRAGEFELENAGTIQHELGRDEGMAIGVVSDSLETRTFDFVNTGTVTGDLVMVGGNALRWWALSTDLGMGTDLSSPITGGTAFDNRLNINSQYGQLDSTITNSKKIEGNFYYGNGAHELINEEGATIVGNIQVDQRAMTITGSCTVGATSGGEPSCFSAATTTGEVLPWYAAEEQSENSSVLITSGGALNASTTYEISLWGAKDFYLENAGKLKGDVTVFTAPETTINGVEVPDSKVVIAPHIFGGGQDDEDDAVNPLAQAYIEGTLKVADGIVNGAGGTTSVARTTTIEPIIDSLVRTGEWYTVATGLYGSEVPDVEESVLVSWEAEKNASGALVIGSTVADASTIANLSAPGIAAVNALMQGGDGEVEALGGALQNLTEEDDVRKAGEQLAPETNFATQQAAFTLNMLTGNYIDNRLNGVGATASPSAAFAAPSGLGMSQTASAAPSGRMSLGLGTDDGRMNIGANDGRMDAGIYDKDPDLRGRGYSAALWGQAFGAGLDQGERQNVDGAQTHIYGGLAGADSWISSNTRLGFAAGYGNTSIDGAGDTAQNETDVDSYFGVLYGAYKGQGWYLSTRASYAWHDYTTKRVLNAGGITDTATGSHSGNQYSASAEVGSPLHYYGATLTPVASLSWSQLDQDGYSETSGGGMALTIASQENTSLASGLGAKALIPIAADTLLEGRAIWYHEFEDTNQQVTAAFSGGSSFLASGPSVGRDTAAIGVGLFAYADAGVSFQLNYDALLRQDFVGHTGSGRLKVEF